jgi:hypothetical protein
MEYDLLDHMEISSNKFRSFVVEGRVHGLLNTGKFYTYTVGTQTLSIHPDQVVAGDSVATRRCDRCAR